MATEARWVHAFLDFIFERSNKQEEFNDYHASMPWLAIPFADKERNSGLNSFFEVEGIPTFCMVEADLKTVINTDARSAVGEDKEEGADFPWYPKPVNNVNASVCKTDSLFVFH